MMTPDHAMMTPEHEEARRLLRLARRDFDTVRLLIPLEQANLATIGFHAQQCAEKALKAVCTFNKLAFRRTHDLVALARLVESAGVGLPFSFEQCRSLNPFAVEFRYDEELTTGLERDEIGSIAEGVLKWAATQVENYIPPLNDDV